MEETIWDEGKYSNKVKNNSYWNSEIGLENLHVGDSTLAYLVGVLNQDVAKEKTTQG